MNCNKCNQWNCDCSLNNTTINSEQAGRDGLSAKAIVIKAGKLPSSATDDQFADYAAGKKGDPGYDGKTPHIDEESANWNIGGVDTETRATESFLYKDNVAELKDISNLEIIRLKSGFYLGVILNGYYSKFDTPAPIRYNVVEQTRVEDGGSVIEAGGLKLFHDFSITGVDVSYYGAKENEEQKAVINKVLSLGLTTRFSKSYRINGNAGAANLNINGIRPVSNQSLIFLNGARLKIAEGNPEGKYQIISLFRVNNVTITDAIVEGDVETHSGSVGEWGHGIYITSCKNITLIKCIAEKCWGDGIAWANAKDENNVTYGANEYIDMINCKANFNRRQGLSIISGIKSRVINFEANETGQIKFTAPAAGVDVEPNPSGDCRIDVEFINLTTRENYGAGLAIVPAMLQSKSQTQENRLFKVKLSGWNSTRDNKAPFNYTRCALRLSGPDLSISDIDQSIKAVGMIELNDVIIDTPTFGGIIVYRWNDSGLLFSMNNVKILNCYEFGEATASVSPRVGLLFHNPQNTQLSYGKVNINNITIKDNRQTPNMYVPVSGINSVGGNDPFENIVLDGVNVDNNYTLSALGQWSLLKLIKGSIKVRSITHVVDNTTTNINLSNYVSPASGQEIVFTNRKEITLPEIIPNKVYRVTITNDVQSGTLRDLFLTTNVPTDVINMKGWVEGRQISLERFASITLETNKLGQWDIIRTKGDVHWRYLITKGTTANRPTARLLPTDAEFQYFDTTIKRPVWWNGSDWTDIYPSLATLTVAGLVKQGVVVPDTATLASGATPTKAEYDALLNELRALKTSIKTSGTLAS